MRTRIAVALALTLLPAVAGCGAFHSSFRTSFHDSFLRSCTAKGAPAATCGCVEEKIEKKYSDADLMKLSADEEEGKRAVQDAARECVAGKR